ncbi:hypothetical protein Tco_1030581 [Tanacetum coccineum]|uniref:Uncharacterized protein n=1 Tax=Tanacetum coccineum TaxID=301880 RepID=A0ABQ5G828_9ASTR
MCAPMIWSSQRWDALGTTLDNALITSMEGLQRATFHHPSPKTVPKAWTKALPSASPQVPDSEAVGGKAPQKAKSKLVSETPRTTRRKCAKNPVRACQGDETAPGEARRSPGQQKGPQTKFTRNSPGDIPKTELASQTNSYPRVVRGRAGERQVYPTDNDPKGDTRNRRCKLPKTTTNAHLEEEASMRNGYWRIIGRRAHTTNECDHCAS